MDAELARMKQEEWNEHIQCLNDLMVYQDAILTTLQSCTR
jgi:hypothetical protein